MAQDVPEEKDTPIIPGTRWHQHSELRPQPPVVEPPAWDGTPVPAPEDAIVLFDGSDLSQWTNDKWKVENGYMEATQGCRDQESKQAFGDMHLHLEFATPVIPPSSEPKRIGAFGNSGVFLMSRYELQIHDSYQRQTYPDGQCGAIYGQTPPMVNACRAPGEWQTYDIIWQAPVFGEDETLISPAYITVIHNGVVIQAHTEVTGRTPHNRIGGYHAHGKGPIRLQDHGQPIRFRNIWVRELTPSS